ncbi:Putative arginine/ornithine antiporter [Candidatus Providencia siddallii]|uniref:Putative arginine/ornithine antiporter n=1 Tax=Candidatus Providencia siddallii TaxID=1715285 RepID=A0A0M6W702_9GAMM|nr:Putative arginine/ornithine antiporter [Candidatus Providencia siddallii]
MKNTLTLTALTALVLSSMVGAGIFSLPQNMAAAASPVALIIGWSITGIGILFLALALLFLSRIRPDLDGGIFTYAKEGFGELIGFCSAWGYWLCAVIANVSYLVIVFATISFFTDINHNIIFGDGNTWKALIGESILLWFVHYLVLQGVQTASLVNKITTIAKLIPLGLFIILGIFSFKIKIFNSDFTGIELGIPIWEQVKRAMLITLWVFIGIEGAVVVSEKAKNRHDVGLATIFAVSCALIVYMLVTLLSLGILPREELAGIKNPSMAGLMVELIGPTGNIVIASGLIISVCGAYLSWIIMATEVPYIASKHKSFPNIFSKLNSNNTPYSSLWLTNIAIQISLILIWISGSNYNTLLLISSEMILIPYFLVGAFLTKTAFKTKNKKLLGIGFAASLYGLWLIYASGIMNLLFSLILYAPGILIFLYTRSQFSIKTPLKFFEKMISILIIITAIPTTIYLINQ